MFCQMFCWVLAPPMRLYQRAFGRGEVTQAPRRLVTPAVFPPDTFVAEEIGEMCRNACILFCQMFC